MKHRLPPSATSSLARFAFPIAAATASLLVALGACGGGDDTPDSTATADPTSRTSTDGAGIGDRSLDGLLETYLSGVDGKITYRTTSENFGEHPNLIWTEYRLGEDRRVDWQNFVENPDDDLMISTIAIFSDAGSYICTTSPGLKSCNLKAPEEAQSLVFWRPSVDEAPKAIAAGVEGTTVSDPAEREIADVQASCFDVESPSRLGDGPPGKENLELCFSEAGALLVMSRTITFTDTAFPTARLDVTAQDVAEADPSDFEPIASPLN